MPSPQGNRDAGAQFGVAEGDGDVVVGTGIEGGKAQKMSKGDFMLVPAGTPHWFTNIEGQITEFSLHLPVN